MSDLELSPSLPPYLMRGIGRMSFPLQPWASVSSTKCSAAGVTFLPPAAGGVGARAVFKIARIGHLVGQRLGTLPAEAVKHLSQWLSICLWKGSGLTAYHPTLLGLTGTSRHIYIL